MELEIYETIGKRYGNHNLEIIWVCNFSVFLPKFEWTRNVSSLGDEVPGAHPGALTSYMGNLFSSLPPSLPTAPVKNPLRGFFYAGAVGREGGREERRFPM